jgi:hypothetical protein
MAAAWFLGAMLTVFVVFAWLRGLGRIVIPLLVLGAIGYAVARFLRKVREPLP